MSFPVPIVPIKAESHVDVKDSCHFFCCLGVGKKTKPASKQTKEVDEIDIKITHIRSASI